MTGARVQRLREMLGWRAPSRPIDWSVVTRLLGVPLPADFMELVEAFPYGDFQYDIRLFHPDRWDDLEEYRQGLVNHADDFRPEAANAGFAMYPDAGGLIPWASVGSERMLCWNPTGPPEEWSTVVCGWASRVWHSYPMSTTDFLAAVLTDPPTIEELGNVTRIVQPPHFTPYDSVEEEPEGPASAYWVAGLDDLSLLEPRFALPELAAHIAHSPPSGFDYDEMMRPLGASLPPDHGAILSGFGALSVGPATVLMPDGSDRGLGAEQAALAVRVKALRDVGAGPNGPVDPEHRGLVLWGRLDGGGYLCWARTSFDFLEWPVVALDASLEHHVTYRMSMSRFLLELATNPAGVVLPPA